MSFFIPRAFVPSVREKSESERERERERAEKNVHEKSSVFSFVGIWCWGWDWDYGVGLALGMGLALALGWSLALNKISGNVPDKIAVLSVLQHKLPQFRVVVLDGRIRRQDFCRLGEQFWSNKEIACSRQLIGPDAFANLHHQQSRLWKHSS